MGFCRCAHRNPHRGVHRFLVSLSQVSADIFEQLSQPLYTLPPVDRLVRLDEHRSARGRADAMAAVRRDLFRRDDGRARAGHYRGHRGAAAPAVPDRDHLDHSGQWLAVLDARTWIRRPRCRYSSLLVVAITSPHWSLNAGLAAILVGGMLMVHVFFRQLLLRNGAGGDRRLKLNDDLRRALDTNELGLAGREAFWAGAGMQ